jgi:hypothetical protein
VSLGTAPGQVLGQLYELADERDLPVEARGEDGGLSWRLRARPPAARAAAGGGAWPATQVPPADLLPRQYTRPTPYLFSDDEVVALMRAAVRMRHRPAALTYQTLTV